jgi:protease-4
MPRVFILGCLIVGLGLPWSTARAAESPKHDAVASQKGDQPRAEVQKRDKAKAARKSPARKPMVVLLSLSGNYPESAGTPGLFGDMKPSLGALVRRLDAAAADKEVAAVWLKIDSLAVGRAKAFELRAAIDRLRKAGKPVYAELTTAEVGEYLVAGACDEIVMPSSGILVVPGVRLEMTFYKGLLDKLGLKFDALQMGKFKGAAEPLTREKMSPPLRESLESVVGDYYDDLVAVMAKDRRLKDYQAKTYVDQGLFTAADAQKAGLIDEVLYGDQLADEIRAKLGTKEVDFNREYKKKKVEIDFSGFGGMMKLMEVLMGEKPTAEAGTKPKIAVVYAVGPITEGKSNSDMFGGSTMGSTTIIEALRKAEADAKVKAIVLRIDSPGGSATASDLIWRETVRIRKPVIASMGDVAGSGGYYIAMGARKIFAAPGTLTGSIGVIGGKLVTGGLMQKLGLRTEVICRGANSGAFSSDQPFTAGERKVLMELLQETYRQFVSKAAEGRKMSYSKLEGLAQGRVYSGRTAKNLGLVDELGTLDDAVAAAKTAAGLKADAEIDLLALPESKSFFEELFGDAASGDMDSLLPEDIQLFRQAAVLRRLLSQRLLTWMPYGLEVK